MNTLLAIVISYLIGSIPFGFLTARVKGINIMEQGSGNTGATNVWRSLGRIPGIIVLILDMGKGIAAVMVGRYLGGLETELLAAFAALCGHSWSIFLSFRGGKIIATGAGILLAISPISMLIATVVLLTTIGISRYVSLGSMLAAISVPISMLVLKMGGAYIVFGVVAMLFAIYKHRSNIERILSGTEFKVGKDR